ncbi:hypothetical protein BC355_18465 [Vibrio cholerae]|uniref:Uncharacterized protein n=1 Tax=Vibrio cholerae TaxID=666 RepID=A0A395TCC0_VIBCL|nr:hypothetical protein [Vibrio cholerae]RGP81898.1 hypothetical protein BC355_18465 [Vibrio cholerae]RGP81925.1 hypothetical protein BC353_18420 [Vibrio cholerae]HEQ3512563.1 hypothetical protein [Vibrio parahaemolyticus]
MKKIITTAVVISASTLASTAHAALDQATVDSIVAGVTSDAGIAIAAGFSILAIVLGGRVGFGLVKSFIASGAS